MMRCSMGGKVRGGIMGGMKRWGGSGQAAVTSLATPRLYASHE